MRQPTEQYVQVRLHLLEIPRPRLEPVGRRGERPHRADLDRVATEVRGERVLREDGDLDAVSPLEEVDHRLAGDLLGEAGATGALDAALPVEQGERAESDRLGPMTLLLDEAGLARAV